MGYKKSEIGNHGNECESIKMYMSRWDEINFTSTWRFRKSWSNSWEGMYFTIPVKQLFVYIVLLSYLPFVIFSIVL